MEGGTRHQPAGFARIGAEAPIAEAEPRDILVGITPAGEIPIEQGGEAVLVGEVIAGAEIAVAEHRLGRRRRMAHEPAYAPFRDRMRLIMSRKEARQRLEPRLSCIMRWCTEGDESITRRPQLVQLCQLPRQAL